MIHKDTQVSVRNIIEYLVKIALVAVFALLWNVNRKVDDISDNKASISKLWQKYGDIDTRLDELNHEVGMLKGRHIE